MEKYTITTVHDAEHPFGNNIDKCLCQHILTETYVLDNKDLAKKTIEDMLDAPLAELTLDLIEEDFSTHDCKISEEKAVQILNYYNGRLALFLTAMSDLDHAKAPVSFHYDIPQSYDSFMDEDVDLHLNRSFLEVKIEEIER